MLGQRLDRRQGLVCSPSMTTESSILEMPESRRTVDPLAMALFGVVRELPANERRVLLSALDGRLHGVRSERAWLALEVLRNASDPDFIVRQPADRIRLSTTDVWSSVACITLSSIS
jgi:hypothetical protein